MKKKKRNKKNWFRRSTRIVGMDPVTFQERWRFNISRVQMISILGLGAFFLFVLAYLIFSFTPIGLILPENVKNRNKEEIEKTILQIDFLEKRVTQQEHYISNLQKVILGEISVDSTFREEELSAENEVVIPVDTAVTEAETILSQKINSKRTGTTENSLNSLNDLFLYDPVRGVVSQKFNKKTHPGVDIIAPEETTIKSCLEGVVMHTSYSDLDGYTVIISHQNDISSIYKHASKVLVKEGTRVNTGDAVAIVGNSGERTTGTHLHFELWGSTGPLDPLDYLSFDK